MEHPSKVLKKYKLFPVKKISQNFLINTHTLIGVEQFFNINDVILEIGAGLGAVTDYFLSNQFFMILCEKDRELANFLIKKYGHKQEIIIANFLDVPIQVWNDKKVSTCVSNLPFHITTEIILKIVKEMPFIKKCLWGMQKEVGQRLCNEKKSSSLSIFLKAHGDIRFLRLIKRNSFYPKPNVDACWVFWERAPKIQEYELFEILLRSAFWGKRKTIFNSLKKSPYLKASMMKLCLKKLQKIPLEIEVLMKKRADALGLSDYLKLFEWLNM